MHSRTLPMSFNCPQASIDADPRLTVQTRKIEAGAQLVRFHGTAYPADSFNPNTGKRIDLPEHGSRFNPFPGPPSSNVPTLYAADTLQAAALESVFHAVQHEPSPTYLRSQLSDWRYSHLETLRDLTVLDLTNPHLRQLSVPGRSISLTEGELIHTPASEYPNTRTWARFLHESLPILDGLAWRPRLGGIGWAYIFFGDRCGTGALQSGPIAIEVSSGPGFLELDEIAKLASIRIIDH